MAYFLDLVASFYGTLWARRLRLRQHYFVLYHLVLYVLPVVLGAGIVFLDAPWSLACFLFLLLYAPLKLGRHFAERRNYFEDL